MCGICGIANYTETEAVEERLLISMRDALTHRGPDDSGLFIDGRVGLRTSAARINIHHKIPVS